MRQHPDYMRRYMMERRADDNFRKKEKEKLVQRKAQNPEQMKELTKRL